jgi:hypothetical protein
MPDGTCKISGCGKRIKALGWCGSHYMRYRRTGSPTGSNARSAVERLLAFVQVADSGCWEWQGARMGSTMAYGQFSLTLMGRRTISAHRASYILLRGDVPDGLELDHLCRNTICVNPDHLEAVTHQVNNARSNSATARNLPKTHC